MAYAQYSRMYRNHSDGRMGTMVSVAAVGFAAGMAANMVRKMAAQAPAAVKGDWMEALKAEHKIILGVFDQMLDTTEQETAKRTALLKTLKGGLAKHAFEEENVIYPALRLNGSDEQAKRLAEDHTDVKTFLLELDMMEKDDPKWIARAREFHASLEAHIREEENDIFPSFRMKMTKEENDKLYRMTQLQAVRLA